MNTQHTLMDSPVGPLTLVARGDALAGLYMIDHKHATLSIGERVAADAVPVLRETIRQLTEYFEHRRNAFDLPLAATGTPFQRAVWAELARIPFGETCAYADLARALDRPKASRAVGTANGRNPISIIVPCHRVVGRDGTLHGYAGGVRIKQWLLAHEAGLVPTTRSS